MGSGIVFSVGGLSSKQDLQRLETERRGEKRVVSREGRRKDFIKEGNQSENKNHQCRPDIFLAFWAAPFSISIGDSLVSALHVGSYSNLRACMFGRIEGLQQRGHAVPSAVSSEHTGPPAIPASPSPRTISFHGLDLWPGISLRNQPDTSCICSACLGM